MNFLDKIFTYYDKLLAPLDPKFQLGISLLIFCFLLIKVYFFIKHGHWLFLAAIIIFLPGTWPATKKVFLMIYLIVKFLVTRIQVNIFN